MLTVKSSSAGTREFAIAGLQVRKRDAPNVASDNHLQTKTLAKPSVSARTVTLGLLGRTQPLHQFSQQGLTIWVLVHNSNADSTSQNKHYKHLTGTL